MTSRASTGDELWILSGAPGSGKTAILDELRGTIRCVDETARRVLSQQRASDGLGTPERDPRTLRGSTARGRDRGVPGTERSNTKVDRSRPSPARMADVG